MKKIWNQEKDDYLKEIYKGRSNKEIATLMSLKFNHKFTGNSVDTRKVKLGLRSGRSCSNKYTREIINYVKNNYKGKSSIELAQEVSKKFNISCNNDSIQNLKSRIKRTEGFIFEPARNDGCFKKGQRSFNKGLKWDDFMSKESQEKSRTTCFKKNNIPLNHRPVGSERINIYGYCEIKIKEPNKWELKHRYLYEKTYGKIPKGYKVIFKDGNKDNVTLENLALVSNAQMLILNHHNLIFEDQELTDVGINVAKVIEKVNEKRRL